MSKKTNQLGFFSPESQSFRKAKEEFDSLVSHKKIKTAVRVSFILPLFSFLILAFFWKKLPPQVPLFYTKPWGEEQLAKDFFLWLLPSLSLILTLINLRIASLLYKDQPFLSYLIVWGNVTICLLSAITLIRILLIIV